MLGRAADRALRFTPTAELRQLHQVVLKCERSPSQARQVGGQSGSKPPDHIEETDVAKVEVRFRRQGRIWTKAATVAQVDGGLLSSLGVSEPFGRFGALLPGCVPPQEINVVARGANGEFLGAQRGRFELPDFCNPAAAIKAAGS